MKQVVGYIHSLPRSGSTILSRCLACMRGNVLLSEIHPCNSQYNIFNPLLQAHHWHKMVDRQDIPLPESYDLGEALTFIAGRCEAQEKRLIIREWSCPDFFPARKAMPPTFHFRTLDELSDRFDCRRIAFIRHPLDQWLSCESHPWMKGRYTVNIFLDACLRFAERIQGIPIYQYEEFCHSPNRILEKICSHYSWPYDPGYSEKWFNYTNVTGDNMVKSRSTGARTIGELSRREVPRELLDALNGNPAYAELLALLHYK